MTAKEAMDIRNNPTYEDVNNKELSQCIDDALEKQIPKNLTFWVTVMTITVICFTILGFALVVKHNTNFIMMSINSALIADRL